MIIWTVREDSKIVHYTSDGIKHETLRDALKHIEHLMKNNLLSDGWDKQFEDFMDRKKKINNILKRD